MSALVAEVRALRKELATLSAVILPVFTRKESQKTLARRAGVHPSTISRRKRAARIRAALGGQPLST